MPTKLLIHKFFGFGSISVANKLVALILTIQLISLIGDEQFGIYTYTLNVANFVAMIVLLGFPQLLTREIASYRAKEEYFLERGLINFTKKVVGFSSLTVACVATLLFYIGDFNNNIYFPAAWISIIVFLTVVFSGLQQSFLRGLHRILSATWPMFILQPIIMYLFVVIFITMGWHASAFDSLIFFVIGSLAAIAVMSYFIKINQAKISSQPIEISSIQTSLWKRSLFPFFLLGGLAMLIQRSDILILGIYLPPKDIAIYAIAMQVSVLTQMPTSILNSIIEPQISVAHTNREQSSLIRLHAVSSALTGTASILAFLLLIFFGDFLLKKVFGQNFSESYNLLIILAAGYAFGGLVGPSGTYLSMTGREKLTLYSMGSAVLLNIVLNFLLIPFFGLEGAAIATFTSLVLGKSFMAFMVWREFGIFPGPVLFSKHKGSS